MCVCVCVGGWWGAKPTKVSPSNCQYLLMSTFAQKGDKVPLAPQPPIQKFSKRGGGGLRWTIRNNFLRIHVIDMFNIIIKQINMSYSSFFLFFLSFFPLFFCTVSLHFFYFKGGGGGNSITTPPPGSDNAPNSNPSPASENLWLVSFDNWCVQNNKLQC